MESVDDGLPGLHVILVEPQGPRNIGAVARAMLNFGVRQLHVVGGRRPTEAEALENAVTARPILFAARRPPDLKTAIGPMNFLVATSGRRRHRVPSMDPKDAAERVLEELTRGDVGLIFGREDHGLTTEELGVAQITVNIPASPACRALNLSHAVAILLYEIFALRNAPREPMAKDSGRVISRALAQRLEAHLLDAMQLVGSVDEGNEEAARQSVARLCAMGPMQSRDARYLFSLARGIRHWFTERPTGKEIPPPPFP